MYQFGITHQNVEVMLGGPVRVSEILTKKRILSLEIIRRLHRKLHIPFGKSHRHGCLKTFAFIPSSNKSSLASSGSDSQARISSTF